MDVGWRNDNLDSSWVKRQRSEHIVGELPSEVKRPITLPVASNEQSSDTVAHAVLLLL